jgi:hypothetical protein
LDVGDSDGPVVFATRRRQGDGHRERQQVSQFHHFHIFPSVKIKGFFKS